MTAEVIKGTESDDLTWIVFDGEASTNTLDMLGGEDEITADSIGAGFEVLNTENIYFDIASAETEGLVYRFYHSRCSGSGSGYIYRSGC